MHHLLTMCVRNWFVDGAVCYGIQVQSCHVNRCILSVSSSPLSGFVPGVRQSSQTTVPGVQQPSQSYPFGLHVHNPLTRLIISYSVPIFTSLYHIRIDSRRMEGITQDMPVSHSSAQERANPSVISVLSPSTEDKGPLPMSFPSILRNSGLTSRYAHLVGPAGSPTVPSQPKKVWRRNDNEGKRWVRRRENGASHFTMHARSLFSLPPAPPQPTTLGAQRKNRMPQPASRTIHTSQRHQSVISSLPSQSHTQHSPSHSHRTSRAVLRSPVRLPRRRTPKRATRGNSASPCAVCARCSGAPAHARKLSYAVSRRSSRAGWVGLRSCWTRTRSPGISSLVALSRAKRKSVKSSAAHSDLSGGSRMIRGCGMSYTAVRGTTT